MEQPWPPPGPWSFPRTGGETEEESDLDVSPSSSHYSPVPDGGAQVTAACVLLGTGDGKCLRASRGTDAKPQPWQHLPRERRWPRAHSRPPRPRTLVLLPGLVAPHLCKRFLLLLSRVSVELCGQLSLHNIDPLSSCACFHPSLYYKLQLLCAQLIGTESDCTSIIVHRVLT